MPKYTIIIAVTHSLKCLEDCLISLKSLDYPRDLFHVVLIDCHVVKDLENFFDKKLGSYDFQITALVLPEQPDKHKSWLHDARINEARNMAMDKIPAEYFVFTEDDCMFEPQWLTKFDEAFQEDIGAAGGPDVLPDKMGWFSVSLDCILNSFWGTAGTKKGDGMHKDWYYPRNQNMVVPAKVLEKIGGFPEEMILETELEIAKRIRDAGWHIKFLPDNPVWHWRETTYLKFVRRNVYQTTEKVKLLRRRQTFIQSPHFLVFSATLFALVLGLLALISENARFFLGGLIIIYMLIVLFIGFTSSARTRSTAVGLGVMLLLPSHHFSIILGVISGVAGKIDSKEIAR